MKKRVRIIGLSLLFMITYTQVSIIAQPGKTYIQVIVVPDHSDWKYALGEKVVFSVQVLKHGNPVKGVEADYQVKPEKMEPVKQGTIVLKTGKEVIKGGSLKEPGFLRCFVNVNIDGEKYSSYATAAFSPEKIEPTVKMPTDFTAFWENNLSELNKVPVEAKVSLRPGLCTEKVNVYQVNIANIKGRIYGTLCVPKKKGQYPAVLELPGAGARPYSGLIHLAEKGVITLQIGIHGVPVDMKPEFYKNLMDGPLNYYWETNLDDKDHYYYKRVYLGCVRTVDYIFTLEEFDGENLAVFGGSQGGALSIVTAALDKRVKYLAVFHPALCDLTGFLYDIAGGWPFLFTNEFTNTPEKINTASYFDVVNFSHEIHIPGIYSWGYNDDVCPPTSMFSAYNQIKAPKELLISQDSGHWRYPEFNKKLENWLLKKLSVEK